MGVTKLACKKSLKKTVRAPFSSGESVDRELELRRQRARTMLSQENRFIYSPEFEGMERSTAPLKAADRLLEELSCGDPDKKPRLKSDAADDETVVFLNWSSSDPLLSFEQEQVLFLALNLARYRINRLRSRLSAETPDVRIMNQIEQKLELVEKIRSQLVRSNLRLVANLARKFSSSFGEVDEFSSDGSMILLGAIDRFDYSRKLRFSTYATHSIQRHFFRSWKVRQRRKERFPSAVSELLSEVPERDSQVRVCDDPESVVRQLMLQAKDVLDEREYQIVGHRFGIGGLNPDGQTLREIAADLGISKERVRQLQMKALDKLRELIDPDLMPVDEIESHAEGYNFDED
ncbi:MAG: sigma-70 family RNA polymerase sigma factor [Planctomycetales bacterium]|jgi:RNA polymerase sigma factor (sigma-70 family)|nr:sigma-70 family RNA polymerase sigma factor [Planctomycetales bacterium]